MHSVLFLGWGQVVGSMGMVGSKSDALYSAIRTKAMEAGRVIPYFYQNLTMLFQTFFHYKNTVFIPVAATIFPTIHTTNNKEQLSIFNLLVINYRRTL